MEDANRATADGMGIMIISNVMTRCKGSDAVTGILANGLILSTRFGSEFSLMHLLIASNHTTHTHTHIPLSLSRA